MKNITAKSIRELNPCENGIENFEEHYPNFEGTIVDILNLKLVPYSDKIWLATKVIEVKILQHWSVKCAESVLPNYENTYPNDTRIRNCIETVKKVLRGELDIESARSAAESARSAARSAAWSARSAAWSARSAAWSAWSAAESAAESAWSAAWSARSAWSAARSAESEDEQEKLNIILLIETIEEFSE